MRLSIGAKVGVLAIVAVAGLDAQGRATPLPAYDVMEKSIEDLQQAMQDRHVTSRELVELYLARIAAYDQQGPRLNAVVTLNPTAREDADRLDGERAAKRVRGPLHGIPILVKDNYETVEMPTTAGSIALATFHPRRDATLVRKLRESGAVILGKTTLHELAMGITNVGSGFGRTRNPYDIARTPGGSSGGTGAAVAANFAAAGMGSDTCGSIRIPAANNNLVGLRGTQGLSSRTGIVPLSSSQDIGGPLARSIADLAIMLDATVGPDPADPQTMLRGGDADEDDDAPEPPGNYRRRLDGDALKGARIGVVRELFGSTPDDQEVTAIVNRALQALKQEGAELRDVAIPGLEHLLVDSSLIASDFKFDLMEYLAKSPDAPVRSLTEILDRGLYHAELEEIFRLRNAPETRETEATRRARIKQGALRHVTSALLAEQRLDAVVYPTLRRRPARLGEPQVGTNCSLSAHSGLPALTVAAGFTTDDVPVGMEFLGPAFSEAELLSLGYATERTLKLRRAPFSTPPLIGGRAPAARTSQATGAGATVRFAYDEPTSTLTYTVAPPARPGTPLLAVWLHSGTEREPGAAHHQLFDARGGAPATASVVLNAALRRRLMAGELLVVFHPARSGERVTVNLPEMRAWK